MNNKITIALIFLFSGIHAYGQKRTGVLPAETFVKIQNIISKAYIEQIDHHYVDTSCVDMVMFAKFRLIDDHVEDLILSDKGPEEIKTALKKALISTNGYWGLKDNARLTRKTFLLPVMIYSHSGCFTGRQTVQITQKPDSTGRLKYIKKDVSIKDGFRNMLMFEDGTSFTDLDCILIHPITIGWLE